VVFRRRQERDAASWSGAGPALNEVEDQDNHGDNQKYVDKAAADIANKAQKPENGDDDGYPKQHEILLRFA
jgi:hypothetical protein